VKKVSFRKKALKLRDAQENKDQLSREIFKKLYKLEAFINAKTVLIYLDINSEVRTRQELDLLLSLKKTIVVPCVNKENLELFHLENINELQKGSFGVLEPTKELRVDNKIIKAQSIDFAIIPGVAFDRSGLRLGYGKGFYDKFLKRLRKDCLRVGIAFKSQVFDFIPSEEHDVSLDMIITQD